MAGEESDPDATRSVFLCHGSARLRVWCGGQRGSGRLEGPGRSADAGSSRRFALWLTTSGYLLVVRHEAERRAVRKSATSADAFVAYYKRSCRGEVLENDAPAEDMLL